MVGKKKCRQCDELDKGVVMASIYTFESIRDLFLVKPSGRFDRARASPVYTHTHIHTPTVSMCFICSCPSRPS